ARLRVDHRELADQRARTENRQDALAARGRHDADLEQALLDTIAAVARIACGEQGLIGLEPMRPRRREQCAGDFRRQHGEKVFGCPRWLRHDFPQTWWTLPILPDARRRAASDKDTP